jgi:hypothetical protein
MRTKKKTIVAASIVGLLFMTTVGFSQGTLTPPGAPAATMKSLDQIYAQLDPRTPLGTNTTPGNANNFYIISQPGSYYLTANITSGLTNTYNGIEILANNVTLDLNGFALQSTATNTAFGINNGIYLPNVQTNVTVRNGSLNGWVDGVESVNAASTSLVFEKLNVANCYKGPVFAASGISTFGAAVIRACNFENDFYGIYCNAASSSAMSLIEDCTVSDGVTGIISYGPVVIKGCTLNNCSSTGINRQSGNGGTISGCAANGNYYGIYDGCGRDRIENNHITGGSYGIDIAGGGSATNNIIIGNTVIGSSVANYTIASGQIDGLLITTTGTIANSNPWANFSF